MTSPYLPSRKLLSFAYLDILLQEVVISLHFALKTVLPFFIVDHFLHAIEILKSWKKIRIGSSTFLRLAPDRIHLLLTLGDVLTVSQVVGQYKSLLRRGNPVSNLRWQGNIYEHLIKKDYECESIGFYMFMNPFKKGSYYC